VAAGTTEQQLAAAHRALLRARDIQFDFAGAPPRPPPPSWVEDLLRALQAVAPAFKYLFWGGLIAGGALILWLVVRELAPWVRRRRSSPPADADWRPEPAAAQALLEDADRLAQAGRFEDAIHLLLFRSIDELAGRRPGLVRPALTSRDIAALPAIPEAPRSAFARLAQAVERSFFGGRPADAAAFGEARQAYQAFAFAEAWR